MDWTTYNASLAIPMAEVMRLAGPEADLRLDYLGEGWGFSIVPFKPFDVAGEKVYELYAEGLHPAAAVAAGLEQLRSSIT